MVNMFMSFGDINYIQDRDGQIVLKEKPKLSWEYNHIRYYNIERIWGLVDGTDIELSPDQCQELEDFIINKRQEVGILKPGVDVDGNYLGIISVNDPRFHKIVTETPPTADEWIWDFTKDKWSIPYYFNEEGLVCSKESSVGFTFVIPPVAIRPFVAIWNKDTSEWTLHDYDKIWETVIRNRLALECFVDCMSTLLINQNKTEVNTVFESIFAQLKLATDDNVKPMLSDYEQFVQKINDPTITPTEILESIYVHKQKISKDNIYKLNVNVLEKLLIIFNSNHNDIFF